MIVLCRYGIHHPVVNDVSIELWERLGITCWPTLVIIGPQQQLLHYIIGEGHAEEFHVFMDTAVEYYKERLSSTNLPLGVGVTKRSTPPLGLKYPGKVHLSEETGLLFVADSSNHRVLSIEQKTGSLLFIDHSNIVSSCHAPYQSPTQELLLLCMAVV